MAMMPFAEKLEETTGLLDAVMELRRSHC